MQISVGVQHHYQLLNVLRHCQSLFPSGPLCTTSVAKHEIWLKEVSQTFRLPMYRYLDEKKLTIWVQEDEILQQRIIKLTTSPVVIVKKKDTTCQLCMDSRRLNKETKDCLLYTSRCV